MNNNLIEAIFQVEKENNSLLTREDISSSLTKIKKKIKQIKEEIKEKHILYDFLEHGNRIFAPSKNLTLKMSYSEDEAKHIAYAAKLHDIGKYKINIKILNKTKPLTKKERKRLRKHIEYGEKVLKSLPALANLIKHHHEWYDGTGYPDKLEGKNIPLGSRIIAVTESWDAMTFERHYNHIKSTDEAIKELKDCAGTQFDPYIVQLFLNNTIYDKLPLI